MDTGPSLRSKVGKGLAWSVVNTVVGRVGQLVVGVALARLIAPEQFGVFAVALVVFNVVVSISELGVSIAIVQAGDRDEVDRIAPVVTSVSVLSGAALGALMALSAPWLASALGAPEAAGPIRVLALSLLIAGLSAVPAACLQREFRQDRKFVGDTAGFVVGTAVAVVMAASGFGAWSLAWSRVAASAVIAVFMFALVSTRYRPAWNAAMARRLLRFGMPLAGASIVVFAVMNVDYAVIGNILGPEPLGVYVLAFNLSGWPVGVFSMTVRQVSLPAFSELRCDPLRHQASFGRALGMLFVPVVPACVLLGVLGGPLVRAVYGERWAAAAAPLAFLAVVGAARVALELVYDFLVSAGQSDTAFRLNLLWLVTLVPTLVVAAHAGGITAVAAGHVIALAVVVLPAHLVALHRLGVQPASIAGPITRPLVGGVAMGAIAGLVVATVPTDPARIVAGGIVSGLVYVAIVGRPLWRQHKRGELFAVRAGRDLVEAAA
ncbi:MAG TPA: lipopolysaccharide biosynthesis protein [Acidimicrobiales bacterium]